jgi:type I restriction enzyme S subunit
VKPLKHLVPWVTVGIVVTPSKYYVDRGVPCLRSLNISAGRIDMDDLVYISQAANQLHAKSIIHEGDVVVVRTGESGTAAVVPAELEGTNCIDLLIVRRSEQLHPKFVYYYLNSSAATYQAELTSVGAIQAHYNTSTLANLLVPVIPLVEQEAIVQRLDEQTQLIDAMVAKVGKAIQQLQELRSALVSAAVTGQVDLRDGAA